MKKTEWKVNNQKTITWKEGTKCNINDTLIFEGQPALGSVISFKNHKVLKNISPSLWVPNIDTSITFEFIQK